MLRRETAGVGKDPGRSDPRGRTTLIGDLTDEQAAYLYASYDAQGGAFSVSGDLMTRVPAVAKDPRLQGNEIVGSFQLDGATLTTEFAGTRPPLSGPSGIP